MTRRVVRHLGIAFLLGSTGPAALASGFYCPGLLTGEYRAAVFEIDYGSDTGIGEVIVIRNGDISDQTPGRDRPEMDDRRQDRELELPLQEITPTEPRKDKEIPIIVPPDVIKRPPAPKAPSNPVKN